MDTPGFVADLFELIGRGLGLCVGLGSLLGSLFTATVMTTHGSHCVPDDVDQKGHDDDIADGQGEIVDGLQDSLLQEVGSWEGTKYDSRNIA